MTVEDLRHAITLVKQGHKQEGAQALMRYLDDEPQNATAWLWLAAAVPDAEKGRFCLEQVLAIDPENKKAREWLARLEAQESAAPAPAPPEAATPEVEPAAEEADVAAAIILEETVAVDAEESAPDTAVDVTAATEEAADEETALSFDEDSFAPDEAEEEFLAFDDDLFADFEAEEEPPAAEPASFEEDLFAVEEGLFELEPEEAPAEPISDEELFKMDDDLAGEEAFAGDDEFPSEEAFAAGAEPEPEAATAPAEEEFLGDEFLADEFAREEAFAGDDESAGDIVDEYAFAADFLSGEAFAAADADVAAEDEEDDFTLFEELAAASDLPGAVASDEPAAEDDLLDFEQDVFGPPAGEEEAAPVEEDTFSFDALLEEAQDEDLEAGDEEFLFAGEFEATDDEGATVVAEPDAAPEPVFTLDEDLASMIPAAEQPAAALDEPAPPQEVPADRPRRRTGQVVVAIIALILLVGICGLIVLFALQFSGI